jgi:hypothetical protein
MGDPGPMPEWLRDEIARRAKAKDGKPLPEWLKQELANRIRRARG